MTRIVNTDFLLEVAKGNVKGHTLIRKFGSGIVGTNLSNIWAGGSASVTEYNYPSAATTMYISSSSASDTGEFEVAWLDDNGDYDKQTYTLTGQTQINTGASTYARVIRAMHVANGGGWGGTPKLNGDVYIAKASGATGGVPNTATDIVAKIEQRIGSTQLGFTTIPNGYTGFLIRFSVSTDSTKSLDVEYEVREYGKSFINKGRFEAVDSGEINRRFFTLDQIPSKADVEFLANVATGTARVSCSFDVLLIDNDLVQPLSFDKTDVGT